jgi:hypothetical protein
MSWWSEATAVFSPGDLPTPKEQRKVAFAAVAAAAEMAKVGSTSKTVRSKFISTASKWREKIYGLEFFTCSHRSLQQMRWKPLWDQVLLRLPRVPRQGRQQIDSQMERAEDVLSRQVWVTSRRREEATTEGGGMAVARMAVHSMYNDCLTL